MTFSKTKYTTQYMQNWGFDDTLKKPMVLAGGFDGTENVQRPEASDLQVKITEAGGYTYVAKSAIGTAVSSADWKVFRVDSSGNKLYADGNANYDNVATDLTALTYSYT